MGRSRIRAWSQMLCTALRCARRRCWMVLVLMVVVMVLVLLLLLMVLWVVVVVVVVVLVLEALLPLTRTLSPEYVSELTTLRLPWVLRLSCGMKRDVRVVSRSVIRSIFDRLWSSMLV